MTFDKILADLEQGHISAEQAKEQTRNLLLQAKYNTCAQNELEKGWYQCGVECAMIMLDLKEMEEVK